MNRFINNMCAIAVLIVLVSACGKPVLNDLDPDAGPPGTIVRVDGSKLLTASVVWDAGLPTEQVIPSNFLSARFFTVPLGATPGNHPVRLKKGSQVSDNTISFDVSGPVLRPDPRIDYVTCYAYQTKPSGKVSLFLLISGANIDVGASVKIDGTEQGAFVTQVLRNTNLYATDPTTLQYPIPNYCALWTVLTDVDPGDIDVQVVNLDGGLSNTKAYTIAASEAELDSDGDGLLDDWEINGYDADGDGTVDIDFADLGADPHHKDLFIEVDWMDGFEPDDGIWGPVEQAFDGAPVMNASGETGIRIHIDRGQDGGDGNEITATEFIRFDNNQVSGAGSTVNFYTLKSANFDDNRLEVYRYCIFADDSGHSPGSSGRAEAFWSNDFYVSLGNFSGGTVNEQVSTFLHELGHTLDLRHGGDEHTNRKPSYNSIMRYGSPGQFPGVDTNCSNAGNNVYTYSQGMRADLNETSLNENLGVCDNNAIDWNSNGAIETGVNRDINANGSTSVLRDFADWANLRLGFTSAGSAWGNN